VRHWVAVNLSSRQRVVCSFVWIGRTLTYCHEVSETTAVSTFAMVVTIAPIIVGLTTNSITAPRSLLAAVMSVEVIAVGVGICVAHHETGVEPDFRSKRGQIVSQPVSRRVNIVIKYLRISPVFFGNNVKVWQRIFST
jgi:hypothetical protein